MKKSRDQRWQFDALQLSALVLVVAVSAGLMGLTAHDRSQAMSVADIVTPPAVQVELANEQPTKIIDRDDQWIGRLKLSTESAAPVTITDLLFNAQGTVSGKFIRFINSHPLTLASNGVTVGAGSEWGFIDGAIQQRVTFDPPLSLDVLHPAMLDIHIDMYEETEETISLWLMDVISPTPISLTGVPIQTPLLAAKSAF